MNRYRFGIQPVTCRWALIAMFAIPATFVRLSSAAEPAAEILPVEGWSTFFSGEQVTLRYRLPPDANSPATLAWSYSVQRRLIARGEQTVSMDTAKPAEVDIALQLPEVRDGIVFDTDLAVQLFDSHGELVAGQQRVLRLFPRDAFPDRRNWLEELEIVLYDPPGETAEVFDGAEILCKTARSLSVLEGTNEGIVVIGEGVSLAEQTKLPEVMIKLAASGVPVLCLAPADGRLMFPDSLTEQPIATSVSFRRTDVIAELDKRLDAEAWAPDGEIVIARLKTASDRGRVFLSVARSPQSPPSPQSPRSWPWLEVTYRGGGRLIVCGFGMIRCWQAGPTPRYLLARILERLSPNTSRPPDATD